MRSFALSFSDVMFHELQFLQSNAPTRFDGRTLDLTLSIDFDALMNLVGCQRGPVEGRHVELTRRGGISAEIDVERDKN